MRPGHRARKAGDRPVIDDVVGRITNHLHIVVNEMSADLVLLVHVVINFDQIFRLVIVS